MNAFFKSHIEMLVKNGHTVDLACNDTDWPIDDFYNILGCRYHHICFSRTPLSVDNIKAYGQLKRVIKNGDYDIVHCHTPNASVITRIVCRRFRNKSGLRVFYTAHGFHFYKGAPKLNWMVYYPIEKLCSRFTDKLITINREDYELAKNKFKSKEVHYVPGVGVDLSRFEDVRVDRAAKRKEIGVPVDAFLLISVGELNNNKNHQIIIRALANLNDLNVHYVIAGVGEKKEYLSALAEELGVAERVHLIGFRNDIAELNHVSDVFCFPSLREGLGVAAIEAMACGLPLVSSNVHGINDYSSDNITGHKCDPMDITGFVSVLKRLCNEPLIRHKMGQKNMELVKRYSIVEINALMKEIYEL